MGDHTYGVWGENRSECAVGCPSLSFPIHEMGLLTFSAITRTVSSLMIFEGLSVLNTLSVERTGDRQHQGGSPLAPQIHGDLPLLCSRTHHGSPWPLREILTGAAAPIGHVQTLHLAEHEGSNFSTSLPALVIFCFLFCCFVFLLFRPFKILKCHY